MFFNPQLSHWVKMRLLFYVQGGSSVEIGIEAAGRFNRQSQGARDLIDPPE